MRWAVLGSRGMFGSDMLELLISKNIDVKGFDSSQINLTKDIEVIEKHIAKFDFVVNATAYTNVNGAEDDMALAFKLNKEAPAKLAQISKANNQKLIHISTDYVFDGSKQSPYETDDQPNPLNVYGESKLAGEQEVLCHDSNALVIRTSWLYGPKGNCFPKAIIKKLQNGETPEVVNDQFGTPTSTWFLRQFCFDSIKHHYPGGVYHGVPTGKTSWFGFAEEIAKSLGREIKPIASVEKANVAKRPANSHLQPHSGITQTWQDCWQEISREFI